MDWVHTFRRSYRMDAAARECQCGKPLDAHACRVGSATDNPCGNTATHISGDCAAHCPRVCPRHPWDDGVDGFCGACLDDYQTGEASPAWTGPRFGPMLRDPYQLAFTLVGDSYRNVQ